MVVLQENPLDLLVQAKSAWDQFRGKEVPLPKDLVRANAQEIKSNPDLDQINKEFTRSGSKDYSVKISRSSGVAVVTFDAEKVPVSLSDDFKDNGKYDKYVFKYDPGSQEVTLVLPLNSSTEESLKVLELDCSRISNKSNASIKSRCVSKESGNPFKSHFICSGCGKTLDQCTCEVESEDVNLEHLKEPKESLNLDSDSKRLKKLISQLVFDSDDEMREFVNAIVDEVIEERSQRESVHKEALDDYNPDDKWHTIAQYNKEFGSIDPKYDDVRLSDDEFHDMYELGYTLGTSNSGAFTSAKKSDYDQYKSGKDVNGNTIKRDSTGEIVRVSKRP